MTIAVVGDLVSRRKVDDIRNLSYAVRWEASSLCVLPDQVLVGCKIYAVNFITCHIAVDPLNVSAKSG